VREFYRNLEVVQDEYHGIILQTYAQGHMLQINSQVISDLIDVPFSDSLESNFMPIPRAMSQLMAVSRSVPFLPLTNCLQRLYYTSYGPQLVGASLF
jgi:hypothetical protein